MNALRLFIVGVVSFATVACSSTSNPHARKAFGPPKPLPPLVEGQVVSRDNPVEAAGGQSIEQLEEKGVIVLRAGHPHWRYDGISFYYDWNLNSDEAQIILDSYRRKTAKR